MNTQTWNASTHASRHVYVSHVAAGKARQQNSKEPEATELNPHADRPQSATETVFYENDIVLKDLQDETIYIFDVIGVVSTGTDEQHVLAETEGGATRKKGSRAWNRTVKWKPQRNNIAPELQLILWNNYFRAGPVYNLPRQDYAICPVSPQRISGRGSRAHPCPVTRTSMRATSSRIIIADRPLHRTSSPRVRE